jgi:hypothetical protein
MRSVKRKWCQARVLVLDLSVVTAPGSLTLACSGSLRVPWFSVLQSIRMHCYRCGDGNCLIKHNGMCKRDALDRLLARVDGKEVEGVEGFWFCIQKKVQELMDG